MASGLARLWIFARAIRSPVTVSAIAAAVFLLAVGSIYLSGRPNEIAALWPANAVILAALLKSRPARWIWVFAAGLAALFLANAVSRIDLFFSAALVGCNAIEIFICDRCMRRFGSPSFDLTKPRTLAVFLLSAGILGPMASASCAAIVYSFIDGAPFFQSFVRWYAPDALGLIAITPALLSLRRRSLVALWRGLKTPYGISAFLAFLICLTTIATNERGALLFLMPVALLFVAYTLETAGAALALLITCVVTVTAAYAGLGAVEIRQDGLQDGRLLVLQTFLASLTFVILPVGAALAERRRLEGRLRGALAKEEHLVRAAREDRRASLLAQHIAGVGHWRRDLGSGLNTWSDEMFAIHGLEDLNPRDLVAGGTRALYDPDDYQRMQTAVERAISTGERFQLETHLTRANDGARRSVLLLGDVERGGDGQICAVIGVMRDTTEERAAQAALEESEARYRLLADVASDVVLKFGPDNRFRYVSPAISQFLWSPENLLRRLGTDIIHPEDRDLILTAVSNLARETTQRMNASRSYRMLKGDGSYVWVETTASIARSPDGSVRAIICQLRDITERRVAMQALAESEARYRIIAENVTDVISRADVHGRLSYVSPSVERTTGRRAHELVGVNIARFIHPDDRTDALARYRAIIDGSDENAAPLAYRIRHKDGHWMWIEASTIALRGEDGRVTEILSVARDVSLRVQREAELRDAAVTSAAAAAVKSDFLANMSHEIRTPLTAILGFTRLLAGRSDFDDAARAQVRRISGAGEALLSIVNDVLDFSRLEAGEFKIARAPASCRDVFESVIAMMAIEAQAKRLSLLLSVKDDLPESVLIDTARVRQVLFNLIGNAIKFTDAGSIEVTLSYDALIRQLCAEVSDTGPGLTDEQQAKLFQRFSQVDASTVRQHGGTGLGLAICKGLVEAMNGAIGVRSTPGNGATFWFTVNAPLAQAAPSTTAATETAALQGLEVLVADDNPSTRELVRAMLSAVGANITLVEDGVAVVAAAAVRAYDVILMDLRMPGQDGEMALRRIRAHPGANRSTPILAFTADTELTAPQAELFNGLVRKPIVARELLMSIVGCL